MRISDWSSDVCSSDLQAADEQRPGADGLDHGHALHPVPGLDAVGLAAQGHGVALLHFEPDAPGLLAAEVLLTDVLRGEGEGAERAGVAHPAPSVLLADDRPGVVPVDVDGALPGEDEPEIGRAHV